MNHKGVRLVFYAQRNGGVLTVKVPVMLCCIDTSLFLMCWRCLTCLHASVSQVKKEYLGCRCQSNPVGLRCFDDQLVNCMYAVGSCGVRTVLPSVVGCDLYE